MKSRIAKISITTATILLMMALVLSTVRPIMSAIQNRLQAFKDQILSYVEEQTALTVSYESVSPNFFWGLRLKGVSISDSFSQSEILTIGRISVDWSLGRMDFSDINDILSHIKNVTVENLTFDWDNGQQKALVQKCMQLFTKNDDSEKSQNSSFRLPFGVTFRSLALQYRQTGFSVQTDLPQIKLTPKKNGSMAVACSGKAAVVLDEKILDMTDSFNVTMKIRGTVTDVLTGSVAQLEITSEEGDVIKLGTTSISAQLHDAGLEVMLVSARKPYSLKGFYGFDEKQVDVSLSAETFRPMSLITVSSGGGLFRKLKNLTVSGMYRISADLDDIMGTGRFSVDGQVAVPAELVAGGLDVVADIEGSADELRARYLSVTSPAMDVAFSGSVDITGRVPQGELTVNRFELPSGEKLEAQFFIDRLSQGFVMFAPQVYAGDMVLTAVQADCLVHDTSVDFTVEASDYSHYETETPGSIVVSGFASWDSGIEVQTEISLNNLFVDSIFRIANSVLKPESAFSDSILETSAPYIVSLDVYATTDFESVLYNMPYAVVANTLQPDQMLLLSLGGNETTVSVTQLNLLYGGIQIDATISADADESYDQIFFGTSFLVNGVPYSLSGAYIDNQLSVQGDYSFEATVSFSGKDGISGSVLFDMLPAVYSSYVLQASADASFEYRSLKDFSVEFNRLSAAESSGNIRIQPAIDLSGSVDQWGMTVTSLTFSDIADVLTGSGYLSWTLDSDADTGAAVLSEGALGLNLANSSMEDRVSLTASFSNPFKTAFSASDLLKNSYLAAQADLHHFSVSHLLDGQASDDTITASVSLQGSLDNPSIFASVPAAYAKIGGSQGSASFEAVLEDRILSVINASVEYGMLAFDQADALFDISTREGTLTANASMDGFISAATPVTLTASVDPEDISARLVLHQLTTDFAPDVMEYPVTFQRSGNVMSLTAGWNEGVQAVLLDTGEFFASARSEFPILFTAAGSVASSDLNVSVSDISFDLSLISGLLDYPFFTLNQGLVTGNAEVSGRLSDPQFGGILSVHDFELGIPAYIDEKISATEVLITAEENSIHLGSPDFVSAGTPLMIDIGFYFDRWSFDYLTINLKMNPGDYLPGHAQQAFLDVHGGVNCNLDMTVSPNSASITGTVSVKNAVCAINNNFSEEPENSENRFNLFCDVTLDIEQKAQVYYPSQSNPIVRGLVSAQSPVRITYDSVAGTYSVDGNLILRGGEILYLNRNFYLREGAVYLKENENGFNPLINLRAETRERTNDGELVRIILSVPNQRLSQINPVLSSDSYLSELEIRTLLGEAILMESGTSTGAALTQLAASGVDYLIQSSVVRELENRLRDSLHFDIFSIRSPFIQQAIQNAFGSEGNVASLKIGNYFDNTVVYIGKYIGTSVYMDAMFSLRYDEKKDDLQTAGFVIQPEIGLEFPAPFANIRWSIAPDLTQSVQNLWVPYTSLSLSWKLSL